MSPRIHKILVPVDGSEGARRALEHALWLTEAISAELTVLQVVEDEGSLPTFDERPPEGARREEWLAAERFRPLEGVLGAASIPFRRRVEQGYPAEVICRIAEEEGFDHVVIGSRGMTAAGRFFLGSVSDRVVHCAPTSVTVIK